MCLKPEYLPEEISKGIISEGLGPARLPISKKQNLADICLQEAAIAASTIQARAPITAEIKIDLPRLSEETLANLRKTPYQIQQEKHDSPCPLSTDNSAALYRRNGEEID